MGVFQKTHPDPAVALGVFLIHDGGESQVFAVKTDGHVRVLHLEEQMMPIGELGNEFKRQSAAFRMRCCSISGGPPLFQLAIRQA